MKKNYRGGRIGEEIKRIISEMLLRELKDPRFGSFVSISAVKAANDGNFATVFITVLDGESESNTSRKNEVIEAFNSAKGIIRKEIGQKLGLRHAPDLQFKIDESEEYGRHIEKIISSLGIEREKEMNSIEDIAGALDDADSIGIFTHENMDGDTLGSAVALCIVMRSLGKECNIIVSEKIPNNIEFVQNDCTINVESGDFSMLPEFDLTILMDVGESTRLDIRQELFEAGDITMCIDHHVSSKAAQDFNYIDTDSSATAEIIFDIIDELGVEIEKSVAEALYTGIVTDTGRFQYENTTSRTHKIAAELLEKGVKPNVIFAEIYQNVSIPKMRLESAIFSTLNLEANGKAAIAYMTQEMLEEAGAIEEDTEGVAEELRSLRNVEVSVFVRETPNGKIKTSMRAKSYYNVSELAQKFGGGGHIRAAGFTSEQSMDEVLTEIARILNSTL